MLLRLPKRIVAQMLSGVGDSIKRFDAEEILEVMRNKGLLYPMIREFGVPPYIQRSLGLETVLDIGRYAEQIFNTDARKDEWNYIQLDSYQFFEGISWIVKNHPHVHSFVDAGCGIGTLMGVAKRVFGLRVEGFEISDELIHKTEYELKKHISRQDITKADYSDFDVVYAFSPIKDIRGMTALLTQLLKTARLGTICFVISLPVDIVSVSVAGKRFSQIHRDVYEVVEDIDD
jgi:SAM-dependent methyltransferase